MDTRAKKRAREQVFSNESNEKAAKKAKLEKLQEAVFALDDQDKKLLVNDVSNVMTVDDIFNWAVNHDQKEWLSTFEEFPNRFRFSKSCLETAVVCGMKNLVSHLCQVYKTDLEKDELNGALFCACSEGHEEIVEILYRMGTNIEDDDFNIIRCALSCENKNMVKKLITLQYPDLNFSDETKSKLSALFKDCQVSFPELGL